MASSGNDDGSSRVNDSDSETCRFPIGQVFQCVSPAYQFIHYWRWGECDNCDERFEDMKLCMKAKLHADQEKAKGLISQV